MAAMKKISASPRAIARLAAAGDAVLLLAHLGESQAMASKATMAWRRVNKHQHRGVKA